MKDFAGTPGTLTGLFLRMGQCLFAAGAIASMVTSKGFFNVTAFWYFLSYFYQFCIYICNTLHFIVVTAPISVLPRIYPKDPPGRGKVCVHSTITRPYL